MGWRFTVLSLVLLVSQTLAIPSLLGNNNHNHDHDHDHNHHHHHHEESNDASEDYYDENSDRSYKFDFEAEGYSREEEADSDGTVVGKYTYIDANGIERSLSYRAGANIGFVPQDGNLLDGQISAGFSSFGKRKSKLRRPHRRQQRKKEPLTSPTRLVQSLIPPQTHRTQGGRNTQNSAPATSAGYPAPVAEPVKFYAPAPPATLYNAPAAPEPIEPVSSYLPPAPAAPEPIEPVSSYLPPAPSAPPVEPPQELYGAPEAPLPDYEAGECPAVNALTDAECAGAVSNCWSPGQLDTDCPNYGLCCFDGCANTCVDDIAPEPTAEAPLSSYLPPAPSAPAPAPPAPLPTYDSASQGTEAPPMMVMDASYNFNFDNDDSFREEESDVNGNVKGKYRYVNSDGNTIEVVYSAGADTGFVIENEQELLSSVARATKDGAEKAKKRMKVVKRRRKKPEPEPLPTPSSLYGAPPAPEPPQSLYGAPPLPVAEPPQSLYGAPETAPDYDAGECPAVNPLTDAECAGAVSNCWSPGQLDTDCPNFGLCCFDGCANTCVDDNAPAPEADSELPTYEKSVDDIKPIWDADVHEAEEEEIKPAKIYFEQPTIDDQTWIQSKAYKYGYSGENSLSRSEISNEDGEVKGTYTIPDANGDPILVRYKAGPKTGYVVDNLDEVLERTNPQGSSESTADQHQPSYNSNNHETSDGSSEPFFDPLADDNPDRSYQFSYGSNEEDASREEVSDAKGNIRGKYRFINADGNTIEVKYSAGADTGFVIENENELTRALTKATNDAAEGQRQSKRRVRVVKKLRHISNRNRNFVPNDNFTKKISNPGANNNKHEVPNQDASFSFKVETEDSSREETSDKNGERIGSYSFVDPNGNTVVVKYRAGRNGFEILNPDEVLPKAPQAY